MYALIHNGQIKVGPRQWNKHFFSEYLEENNLDTSSLTFSAPATAILGNTWKIVPVVITEPSYDPTYEQLVGPTYVIDDQLVTGSYTVVDQPLQQVKNKFKEIVTKNRYEREIGGTTFTCDDTTEVQVYTNRQDRNVYMDALLTTPDGGTVTFKFVGAVWKTVTKSEIQGIVNTIRQHVQDAFVWEATTHAQIEQCADKAALALVDLGNVSQGV